MTVRAISAPAGESGDHRHAPAKKLSPRLGQRRSASAIDRLPEFVQDLLHDMIDQPEAYIYDDVIDRVLVETTPDEPVWLRQGVQERLEAGRAVYTAKKTRENYRVYAAAREDARAWAADSMRAHGVAPIAGTDGPVKLSDSTVSRRYCSAARAAREIERNAELWARTWRETDPDTALSMIHTTNVMLQSALMDALQGADDVKTLTKLARLMQAGASYAKAAVQVEKARQDHRALWESAHREIMAKAREILDEHPRERDLVVAAVNEAMQRLDGEHVPTPRAGKGRRK